MSTILAPLPLLEANTPGVESLASYVRRLAMTHGISPFRFGRFISERWALGGSRYHRFDFDYLPLCSYSPSTKHAVEILESLTGQRNLAQGTLLPLAPCLTTNYSGSVSRERRWCPACYRGTESLNMEPLAWGMSLIKWCPIHDVELQSQCAWCGSRQHHFRCTDLHLRCRACDRPLSQPRVEDKGLRTPWNTWCQQQMLDLLCRMTADDCPPFPDAPLKLIAEAVARWPAAERARLELLQHALKAALATGGKPRLVTVFRFAAVQSCTPFDVLQAPLACSSRLLFDSSAPVQAPPRKPRIKPSVLAAFHEELLRLLKTPEVQPLPSLRSMCSAFGLTPTQLYASQHDLYARYGAERKRRYSGCRSMMSQRAAVVAMEELRRALKSGTPPKRKRSVAKIIEITRLPKHIVEAAWDSARAVIAHERNRGVSPAAGGSA